VLYQYAVLRSRCSSAYFTGVSEPYVHRAVHHLHGATTKDILADRQESRHA